MARRVNFGYVPRGETAAGRRKHTAVQMVWGVGEMVAAFGTHK